MGLVAIELWAMHFVELKRWQDFFNPGSVDTDPLFPQNKLPAHEVRHAAATRVVRQGCMRAHVASTFASCGTVRGRRLRGRASHTASGFRCPSPRSATPAASSLPSSLATWTSSRQGGLGTGGRAGAYEGMSMAWSASTVGGTRASAAAHAVLPPATNTRRRTNLATPGEGDQERPPGHARVHRCAAPQPPSAAAFAWWRAAFAAATCGLCLPALPAWLPCLSAANHLLRSHVASPRPLCPQAL